VVACTRAPENTNAGFGETPLGDAEAPGDTKEDTEALNARKMIIYFLNT